MNLRISTLSDIPDIMEIISDAQSYLAKLGIDQWQNGYPDEEQIRLDIFNNDSYVVINEKEEVMATTVFTTKPESSYNEIEGDWLTPIKSTYGVIHRLAVKNDYRKLGLAKFIFNKCEEKLRGMNVVCMRIDTHRENKGMQNLIKNLGYSYCGIIYLEDGDERFAFEKLLV